MPTSTYATLPGLLQDRVEQSPASKLFTFLDDATGEETHLSNAELGENAQHIHNWIVSEGGHVGDVVLLVLPPGLLYVNALFACMGTGFVATPLYPPGKRGPNLETFMAVLAKTQATTILTTMCAR